MYVCIETNEYVLSPFGGGCNDTGKYHLANENECRLVARSLSRVFKYVEETETYPKGCYTVTLRYVYWNTHNVGKTNSGAAEICKKEGSFIR